MDVFLYNSTVCRLCGEENDNGTLLYSPEENNQSLGEVVNTYLPIKVNDDGRLPRTICPGCTIQLEATVEFLTLIINGQKVIRELYNREKDYKRTINLVSEEEVVTDKTVYDVNTSDGMYYAEHPITLQVAGLEKPKRKRGRPPKKHKTPEQLAQEAAAKEHQLKSKKTNKEEEKYKYEPSNGKRRRKTPTRFREAVQGKELERIFLEEGVIDGEESEHDVKPDLEVLIKTQPKEPEVIGHMEESGELVVVVKGKGRGRPKGPMRPIHKQCVICGKEFSCAGRYMSHVAQHGPVTYQCSECLAAFHTLLDCNTHQKQVGHTGQNVLPYVKDNETVENQEITVIKDESNGPFLDKLEIVEVEKVDQSLIIPDSLPDLSTPTKPDETVNVETEDAVEVASSPSCDVIVDSTSQVVSESNNEVENVEVAPKGKVRLKCSQCDKTFSNKQSKSLHYRAAHLGEKPYSCAECGAKFAYPRSLALHKVSHRRNRPNARGYACDLCGKVLNHPSSIVYHKEAEHAGQRYVCNKCGKSFKHKQLLQRHQLVHSQIRPYNCKICNSSFKTKANLLNHQLLHSGVKKFSCELCKQKFAHKTSLTLHMRWHSGQKPYSCNRCGKSFSQKGNLSEHLRIHTGEKPFQCTQCNRRFTTSSQHRLHARRHLNEREHDLPPHNQKRFAPRSPWAAQARGALTSHGCGACGRTSPARAALLRHARAHRGERAYRCAHCPRTFADCSNLNKHKKQVHKQISLLANRQPQLRELVESPESSLQLIESATQSPLQLVESATQSPVQLTVDDSQDSDERVIYVTYDVDDPDASSFHIISPEQVENLESRKEVSTCDIYSGSSLLVPHPELQHDELHEQYVQHVQHAQHLHQLDQHEFELDEPLVLSPGEHMPVTDEQGNPLHFTMQDGTRLAITSADGKSLQVITEDGQTIPVEINGFAEEEELDSPETIIHQLDLEKGDDSDSAVTHYFTIV